VGKEKSFHIHIFITVYHRIAGGRKQALPPWKVAFTDMFERLYSCSVSNLGDLVLVCHSRNFPFYGIFAVEQSLQNISTAHPKNEYCLMLPKQKLSYFIKKTTIFEV
jgi:hypothetical protein